MKTKKLIQIVILGAIVESVSLGTENSFSTYEFDETNIERIIGVEKAPRFELSRIETNTDINKYLDEAYKKLSLPDYINKKFIKSVIKAESGNYTYATSPVGARGLMQITQDAWEQVEEKGYSISSFDPRLNIEVGIKYLLHLNEYLKNNYSNWGNLSDKEKRRLISAAYNGGIGRLEKRNWEIKSMPKETKKYVEKVYTE